MKPIIRTLSFLIAVAVFAFGTAMADQAWLPASAEKLPVWRGFNLLEKFHKDWSNGPFKEEDFQLIQELGFNFVRLPMDYRVWIENDDWRAINEDVIREIDQAVAWGDQYGIHVSINFHRAPGHTVAEPAEATSVWSDPEAQEVCALHWAYFARRYKGIPNARLSFNLFNEPAVVSGEAYARVVKIMAEAIRAEDPDRLIIADGLRWGRQPCPELLPLGVAQATRGYDPSNISHYQATWVDTSYMVKPAWPLPKTTRFVYGPDQGDLHGPLRLEGPFLHNTALRLRVGTVSRRSHLVVSADGDPIWEHRFVCSDGEGEWQEVIWKEEWGVFQNRYDRDYVVEIPAGTQSIEIVNIDGDWLTITELGLRTGERSSESVLELMARWGESNGPIRATVKRENWTFQTTAMLDRDWLWQEQVVPWKEIERQGCGVMVGEWGVFNKTPHDVTLRWMEDGLKNWQKAEWGWALWNFRGSFGILDSGREDVDYEDWHGHKLDRKMLELLRRY